MHCFAIAHEEQKYNMRRKEHVHHLVTSWMRRSLQHPIRHSLLVLAANTTKAIIIMMMNHVMKLACHEQTTSSESSTSDGSTWSVITITLRYLDDSVK